MGINTTAFQKVNKFCRIEQQCSGFFSKNRRFLYHSGERKRPCGHPTCLVGHTAAPATILLGFNNPHPLSLAFPAFETRIETPGKGC
jgi:hypothetical protein